MGQAILVQTLPRADPPLSKELVSECSQSFFLNLTGSGTSVLFSDFEHKRCLPILPPSSGAMWSPSTHMQPPGPLRMPLPVYLAVPMFRYWHSSRCLKVFLKVALQRA